MRKKPKRKPRKPPEANALQDEEKIARLEAIKTKREEIKAMMKRKLDDKFNERIAATRGNTQKQEQDRERKLINEMKSSNDRKMIQIREEMKSIVTAGIEKVHAAKILHEKVKFDVKLATLIISSNKYKLNKNVHVVGWGLEALMLASAFEKLIGDHLQKGWLVIPRRTIAKMSIYPELFPQLNTRITFSEAASDDIPDEICVGATKNIFDYCKKLKKDDILVVILSQGSDDMLSMPKGTIGLREKRKLFDQLYEAGATSREINTVRRSLSAVRDGGLAKAAYPAKVISLVMSDVGPDDLHVQQIAGGPTIYEDIQGVVSTARGLLDKYNLRAQNLSYGIREVLKDPELANSSALEYSNMLDEGKRFKFVSNYIVASSSEAIDEMAVTAFRLGYVTVKLTAVGSYVTKTDEPKVRQISKEYAKIIALLILAVENKITTTEVYESLKNSKIFDISENKLLEIFPSKEKWGRGLYLLISPPKISMNLPKSMENGEAYTGKTGNNQELSLYFSLDWYLKTEQYPILKKYVVWFLGVASAGRDGNTKYAGAFGYSNLAVDVYRKFKNNFFKSVRTQDCNVSCSQGGSKDPEEKDISIKDEEDEKRSIHEAILPDRVLREGNTNFLFLNVNDGDDLLELGNSSSYTFTNIGDLHIIRIVRYQCSCDGLCTLSDRAK